MIFLPIVQRELRVAARRAGTYWARLTAAALTMGVGLMMLAAMSPRMQPQMAGQQLFQFLVWALFVYALAAGLSATMDCLSWEKREGTLGLLFLTDLKGHDIVLGKLAATSVTCVYGLVATLPVLALALLLGGVGAGELVRAAVVLLNTLFFSLSMGLFASAVCRRADRAGSLAVLGVLFFTGLWPLGVNLAVALLGERGLELAPATVSALMLPAPWSSCWQVFAGPYSRSAHHFVWSVLMIHALGWGGLWLASRITPRAWQDRPATVKTLRWTERLRRWAQGSASVRAAYRQQLLDINAIHWLTCRDRLQPAYVWLALGLMAAGWGWGWAVWKREWLNPPVAIFSALALHVMLKLWVASEAVSHFAEELRQGTLELWISTRLSVEDALQGQWDSLQRQFFRPALAVLAADAFLMLACAGVGNPERLEAASRWQICFVFLGGMAVCIADLYTLGWVGMWRGLAAKDLQHAKSDTVVSVLVLPWVIFYGSMVFASLFLWRWNWGFEPTPELIMGFWLLINLGVDFGLGRRSRQRLRAEFRVLALRRYADQPAHPLWRQLGLAWGRWWLR